MDSSVEVSATARNAVVTSPVWTLKQAAAYLGVGVNWVRQCVYRGDLPHRILAGRYVIPRSDVEAFLNRGWKRNGTLNTSQSRKN